MNLRHLRYFIKVVGKTEERQRGVACARIPLFDTGWMPILIMRPTRSFPKNDTRVYHFNSRHR
jgi:hypothetical protein